MKKLCVVVSGEKMYVGKVDIEDTTESNVTMEEALEIRELLVPSDGGQIQRMVNFTTVSPFDKTPHTIIIRKISVFVKIEDGSETESNYNNYIGHLRQANSRIEIVQPGVDFGGKFGPQ